MKLNVILLLLLFYCNLMGQTPQVMWGKSLGGVKDDYTWHFARDRAGNIYQTIHFRTSPGTIDTISLSPGMYILKFSKTGKLLWYKQEGAANSIVINSSDELILAGYGLAKYDTSGNLIWKNPINGISTIDTDADGNIYAAGIGSCANSQPWGISSNCIFKFDQFGKQIWTVPILGNICTANAIKTDKDGNSYVTGWYGAQNPGSSGYQLPEGESKDVFLTKFDKNGNLLFAKAGIGERSEMGIDVGLDNNGNCYVTGDIYGEFTFEGQTVNEIGGFVVKIDSTGTLQWLKGHHGGRPTAITTDHRGIYVTGTFAEEFSFENIDDYSNTQDIYLLALNFNGGASGFFRSTSTSKFNESTDIDINGNSCVLIGLIHGEVSFGSVTYASTYDDTNDFISKDGLIVELDISNLLVSSTQENILGNSHLYPNPTSNHLFYEPGKEINEYSIYSSTGALLKTSHVQENSGRIKIDVSNFRSGMYFIEFKNSKKKNCFLKFIKK